MSDFISSALWNWLLGWPWQAQVALGVAIVLFLWGSLHGLYVAAQKIGGWQAGAGAVLAIIALLSALWPRKRSTDIHEHVAGKDAAPPPKRKKRPTIGDLFKRN